MIMNYLPIALRYNQWFKSSWAYLKLSHKKNTNVIPMFSTSGMTSSRIRSNGQSPLTIRTPIKAVNPVGSMVPGHQQTRGLPVIQGPSAGGGRRGQSPGSANGRAYIPGRASTGAMRPAVGQGQAASTLSTRSKLAQPTRRWVCV